MESGDKKEYKNIIQVDRMDYAISELEKLGIDILNKGQSENLILFYWNDRPVYFYPYTGWHSGKTIKDGRGLQNLLNQLK